MTLRIRPEAAADVAEAARWYETQQPGLGGRLIQSVDDTLARIDTGPLRFPVTFAGLRRALVRKFPYSVFFDVEGDDRIIFAVHHQSMSRDTILDRLDQD